MKKKLGNTDLYYIWIVLLLFRYNDTRQMKSVSKWKNVKMCVGVERERSKEHLNVTKIKLRGRFNE